MTSRRELLEDAARRAARYLDGLGDRKVAPDAAAVRALAQLDTPLADSPTDAREILRRLDEHGSGATMAMAGGRFFGFVIGGALPATVAASYLATAWDQNTGLHSVTPATAQLERIALGWLVDLLGLPPATGGGFVTGATLANFTGLAAARHAVLEKAGWDVEGQGLFGAPPIQVVIGEEAHPTLVKALGMLGLGRSRVTAVPADAQGRMRPELLPELRAPAIVCLQAGNVNTGAFDPAAEIVKPAQEAGAWVHVDGAFGLWALASPRLRALGAGLADADSWATDAHKWLNVPYDSGLALCRHADAMRAALAIRASYLPTTGERDPSDFTPELSRRARGVEVWAALASLGRSGVAAMLERCCAHARRFARELSSAGFEILNDVVLNQVLVAFGDAETTRRVVRGVQEDGTCWCGGSHWHGREAMRISVCSWATTDEDVEASLEAIIRVAAQVRTAA